MQRGRYHCCNCYIGPVEMHRSPRQISCQEMMSEKCTFKLLSERSERQCCSSNRLTAVRSTPVQLSPETLMHNKPTFVAVLVQSLGF